MAEHQFHDPFAYIHPRDQIVLVMERVYRHGMTTTSGGNLSIRESNGDIWITPAGTDKGSMGWEDVVSIRADGEVKGRHRPSSEYPFHRAIYEARPDLGGIVHAHPSALVSFSIVREVPSTRIIPQAYDVCGKLGFAPYALPGSEELGKKIAEAFAEGCDCVILENHGVVCGGVDLPHAFQRFETLDFCARLLIKAKMLGCVKELTDAQLDLFRHRKHFLEEFEGHSPSSKEKALRRHVCETLHRAYDMQLMTSTEGVVSVRLDGDTFLISPTKLDRRLIETKDIVLIKDGKREKGKLPSRSVLLHQQIYQDHPHIQSIVTAQAPNSIAFGLSDASFETRTIPESYILLRDIPKLPFGPQMTDEKSVSARLSADCPVMILENDAIMATGGSILQAFDRLEVAEFSARSLIDAKMLGGVVVIGEEDIRELERAFLGKS